MVTLFTPTSNANKVRKNDLILLLKAESTYHRWEKWARSSRNIAHLWGCRCCLCNAGAVNCQAHRMQSIVNIDHCACYSRGQGWSQEGRCVSNIVCKHRPPKCCFTAVIWVAIMTKRISSSHGSSFPPQHWCFTQK
jgi:hypothetical protein